MSRCDALTSKVFKQIYYFRKKLVRFNVEDVVENLKNSLFKAFSGNYEKKSQAII